MAQLGAKPSSAPGGGYLAVDVARASRIGSFRSPVWLTMIHAGLGRAASGTGSAQLGVHGITGGNPGVAKYVTDPFPVTHYMDTQRPGGTGRMYSRPIPPGVLVNAGEELAVVVYNAGSIPLGFWQDNSGRIMHHRTGVSSYPTTFNQTYEDPQGLISISIEGQVNRPPDKPVLQVPHDGSVVIDTTPSVVFTASDPDWQLGDDIDQIRVEVWNMAETSRLYDSTWIPAPSPVLGIYYTHGITTPLTQGQSVRLRITTKDMAGAVSPVAKSVFTVEAAGAFVDITVDGVAGVNPEGNDVITTDTPGMTATWEHEDSIAADITELRITKASDGSVYRGPYVIGSDFDDGDPIDWAFSIPNPDWAPLASGSNVYYYELRGTDTNGAVGGWNRSRPFQVNAQPVLFSKFPAVDAVVTAGPPFWAKIIDTNDGQERLVNVGFQVQKVGGSSLTIPAIYDEDEEEWVQSTSALSVVARVSYFISQGLGDYQWRVVGADPWGSPIADDWRTFTITTPPAITITSPTDESTVTTATPTVSATSDRTLTLYRVRVFNASNHSLIWDSQEQPVAAAGFSTSIPAGLLRNRRDYDMETWVQAADGLENTVTTQFTVQFTPKPHLTNVTGEAVPSSDLDLPQWSLVGQAPNALFTWTKPSVSANTWRNYNIIRISPDGRSRHWTIDTLDTTVFEDPTPAGTMEHTYYLGYEVWENSGKDIVHSVYVKIPLTVTVNHSTLTSENPDDPPATFHFWRTRGVTPVHDKAAIPVMGLRAPIGFQGELEYDIIEAEFQVLDEETEAKTFTARDVVNRARDLAGLQDLDHIDRLINVIYGAIGSDTYIGRPVRRLFYRDPKGRAVPVMVMAGPDETDHHENDRATFRMQLMEIASPIVYIEDFELDDVIDISDL